MQESHDNGSKRPSSSATSASSPRVLDSVVLFGGTREVRIAHAGETYRLTVTRQGKLILTK